MFDSIAAAASASDGFVVGVDSDQSSQSDTVITSAMTNWIAANLVTWAFDASSLKNVAEYGKTGYVYKTTFNGVATPKLGLDKLFPGSQVNAGILIALLFAVLIYILMSKTTLGYELKACGANRHAARYAGIRDKRNIVLSMAIAGALAGTAGSLYYLSGNTEFFWSTYQSLPAVGFNGIPVALLAVNNPIAVIFTGIFMAACVAYPDFKMLDFTGTSDNYAVDAGDINIGISIMKGNSELVGDCNSVLSGMGSEGLNYNIILQDVEKNGLRLYGFAITAKKDTILELSRDPAVSYIYASVLK